MSERVGVRLARSTPLRPFRRRAVTRRRQPVPRFPLPKSAGSREYPGDCDGQLLLARRTEEMTNVERGMSKYSFAVFCLHVIIRHSSFDIRHSGRLTAN